MNTVAVENLGPTATEETLMNYFENKRRSGGGPVREVKIDTKKRTAFVTFENPADAKNVTSRDHILDKHKFKAVLSKPPEVMKDRVVLRGLPDSASRGQIINFVESLTDVDVQTVLYGEEDVAVVVFKTEIDIPTIRTALTKRQLQGHILSVEEVPVSCTILVKNTKLSKDVLTLYFESVRRSGGGDVTEVVMGEKGEYALVTFEDTNVAVSVAKRKHKLEDQEMNVTIWMECLGINGSEEPVMKPVDPVAISSSDQWKISLLKEGCQVMLEDLENELQKHHARLVWSVPERSVQLICCLTSETPGARELAKTWAENVVSVLQNHLCTVKVEEVDVTREEYAEMAPLLQGEAGKARVVMTFDEEKGRVIIVWDRDETVDIIRNLQITISKMKERFNRIKRERCVHREINKWKMILLEKNKTDKKLKDKYPELEVTYDFEKCCMILKGVDEEIHEMELIAEADINKIFSRDHSWTSPLTKELWTFPEVKTYFESTCSGQDSECVLELTVNGFTVYSFNEEKVNEMLMFGQSALVEHVIPLAEETEGARRLPQWEELKTSIQERNRGLVLIHEDQSSLTVMRLNTTPNFEIQELREFLEENGSYQYSSQIDDVYSQLLLTFMSENLDTRIQQEVFRIDDIVFDDVTKSIVVKGNKSAIQAAREIKNHFDMTLVCKKKRLTQPCMKEFLKCVDWRFRRTEIEQRLTCRILEPAECPPELASIAVDTVQAVVALASAPVQGRATAAPIAGPALRQIIPNAQGIKSYPYFENLWCNENLIFMANSSQVIEEAERELVECYHGKIVTVSFDVPRLDQWDDYHVTTLINAGIASNADVTFNYNLHRLEFRGFEDTVRQIPVHLMIKNAEKHVQDKVAADLLAKQVQWNAVVVTETDEVLQPYSRINNYLIETAYRNGKASLFIVCERVNHSVNINFSQMEESPEDPKLAKGVVPTRIVRHDLLQGMALEAPLPDHWSNMKDEIDVVPLSTGSRDYIRVAEVFRTSSNQLRLKIIRISRVQNKTLHKHYMDMKKQIVASLPSGKRCERVNMWHGTKEGSVDGIVRYGFNRSYSNCVENYYGQGVYFATEAEYSIRDAYASRNFIGESHIFMCKVLVGEYTVGKPEMRFPPEIPNSNGRRYNSVVDDKETPSTFVIFSDVQAYPEYVIVFK